jgi:DNA-binding NarL/FixJ family response regulator
MENRELTLYIVGRHALVVNGLKHYLENRFGSSLHIYPFYDGKSCLKNINENTQAVVLDYMMEDMDWEKMLRSIKTINPNTEGIVHFTSEEVAEHINALLTGNEKTKSLLKKLQPEFIN